MQILAVAPFTSSDTEDGRNCLPEKTRTEASGCGGGFIERDAIVEGGTTDCAATDVAAISSPPTVSVRIVRLRLNNLPPPRV
ncbi:MAG: hypothetical protein K0S66_2372 [Sphingomonas sp.]|nr:hypothetical protein [Sphingomonas sp.]